MDLYEEILAHALTHADITVTFPAINISQIVEGICYKTLKRIKAIIEDDSLEDNECFMRIEEIICEFEAIGSDGGNRHDFG